MSGPIEEATSHITDPASSRVTQFYRSPGAKGGGITETKAYIHQLEQVLLDALNDLGLKDCGRIDGTPVYGQPPLVKATKNSGNRSANESRSNDAQPW